MKKKKKILGKISQVENKKAVLDKAMVDLDSKIDHGDFTDCLRIINNIKEVKKQFKPLRKRFMKSRI